MKTTYKIHPAIGIARVGNSPDSFYICPEKAAALPIDCGPDGVPIVGPDGQEKTVTNYKDSQNRIRRQAARFRIYCYNDASPKGVELKIGDAVAVTLLPSKRGTGQAITGTLVDIQWKVYLANKKASWYEFQELSGEHGYSASHPLRNADIQGADARQRLIIDPGPRKVSWANPKLRKAEFNNAAPDGTPRSFPPPDLQPFAVQTLGELRSTTGADGHNRLLVLGGFGNSGSMRKGLNEPSIQTFANNDGWFDDISDGPVTATLVVQPLTIDGSPAPAGAGPVAVSVDSPAWVITGYPRYAPEVTDIVTMDDIEQDLAVRNFGAAPQIYNNGQWNRDYYPYFWRDIWPILKRPINYQFLMDPDAMNGADPHQTAKGSGGNFDPDLLSNPPTGSSSPAEKNSNFARRFLYNVLRKPGQENLLYLTGFKPGKIPFGMPLLCGDNPITNTLPSKFLRLTETMLFLLSQWADGKFVNEQAEDITPPPLPEGEALDRGVLGNVLGGAFCPGAETSWIMRNPAIYSEPYRIRHAKGVVPGSLSQPAVVQGADTTASLKDGAEPGDITKYSGVPWQSDFNECTTQDISINYELWNEVDPDSTGDTFKPVTQLTYWWPAHRPDFIGSSPWSPTPITNAGDLQMVSVWPQLGFVVQKPGSTPGNLQFTVVENQIGS